jgi:hypothetical protein
VYPVDFDDSHVDALERTLHSARSSIADIIAAVHFLTLAAAGLLVDE